MRSLSNYLLTSLLLFLFYAVTVAASSQSSSIITEFGSHEDPVRDLYDSWLKHNEKAYNGETEKEMRFKIFKNNLKTVNEHNMKSSNYKLELNKFADLSNEEFRAKYLGTKVHKKSSSPSTSFRYGHVDVNQLPTTMDWRTAGAVTHIKDQGSCGSCWAFSTVAAVEGIHYLTNKTLISLSEQELVDCDKEENEGCNGGFMDYAFQYIIKNKGITTESDYPYRAEDGNCNTSKEKHLAVSINGFEDVPTENEDALLKAVAHQPVSIAIEAGQDPFQFYASGIFTGTCGTDLDHGVALVGYGTSETGNKYWIVKNSWGTNWGESGYIRMKRTGSGSGLCGINLEASYPTMTAGIETTTNRATA